MSDDMVDFLARAQYAANSWWRAAKDDDDGLGRYKMHGDVRLRAIEWEHLYADEQDDFLQSARAILTAIEASGRRIVPVDPKSRARELWEDAARDALSASPKVTT
jgi:hypothetical protein